MRVILREDVPHVGMAGDVVEVKNGFARNYLLPRRLALQATATSVRGMAHQKKLGEDRLRKLRKDAEGRKERLAGVECVIPMKAGEGDRLYGSVTTMLIHDALAVQGIELDRRRILLEEPLKQLGDHPVRVRLHPEVTAELLVRVVREQEEEPPAGEPPAEEAAAERAEEPLEPPPGE